LCSFVFQINKNKYFSTQLFFYFFFGNDLQILQDRKHNRNLFTLLQLINVFFSLLKFSTFFYRLSKHFYLVDVF